METPPAATGRSREISGFLNRLEYRLEELDRSLFLAWWNQYAGVSSAGTRRWDTLRSRLFGREDLLKFLRASQLRPQSPRTTRRIELFRRIAEDCLVEQHPAVVRIRAPLIRRVFAFTPKWNGRRTTGARLREILRDDDDRRVRRAAYFALQELWRDLERDLPVLVDARNARARELGYQSFMDFRLQSERLTLRQLEGFIDRIAPAGRHAQRRFRESFADRSGESGFFPWDSWRAYDGRNPLPASAFRGRTMVPDLLRTLRAWGFQGPRRPFRIVQRSIPVGGMTLAVQIPSDVRIAVNPKGGWLNYTILAHEFGHAVQDHYTRAPTHLLRGPENIPGFAGFFEGVAGLFERIPYCESWLRTRPDVTSETVQQFRENFADEELRAGALTAVWVRKEIQLYRQPWSDLARRFHRDDIESAGFDPYPEGSFADPFWIEAAFYSKSYLLASIFGAQYRQAIREQVPGGFWPNRKIIPWLARNLFRDGARYDWVPRAQEVTGRPFGVSDFLDRAHREE